MSRVADHRGFTLIEMLVTLGVAFVVFAAALSGLEVFTRFNGSAQRRNETQDQARTATDRMAFALRNVAAPSGGAGGTLEQAGPYSVVFQTVDTAQVAGGLNVTNTKRARYCLTASNPTNNVLWKQEQTWTTATAPPLPGTTACPDSSWPSQTMLVPNVTNTTHSRPVFVYGPGATPSLAQISSIEIDLFLDLGPGQRPGESELTSGVSLRNSNQPPTAGFTATEANGHVLLNASTSSDPNGQALTYQWSLDSTAITGATTQQYDIAGLLSKSTHTIMLTVGDSGGLTNSMTQQVTLP